MASTVKRTKEYLIAACAVFAVFIIAIVIAGVSLSGMSIPYHDPSSQEEDIVLRAAALTNNSGSVRTALYRVGAGFLTAGDYTIRSFTSSDYLINGKDDAAFASDLSSVINGQEDPEQVSSIMSMLESSSRMYVINETIREEDPSLKASGRVPDVPGDSFSDCVLTSSLEGEGGLTIGIRKVEGSFVTTGDEIRTDFFVDGMSYQGNITISESEEGSKSFVMTWNTNGISSGVHQVLILLRSSDGRGTVLAGGDIFVPNTMTLVNYNVQPGSISEGSNASWYSLDAQDGNAYINFVNLSGDIRVSIYNAYGDLVGTNDLPGNDLEILRAARQDIQAMTEDTGLTGLTNTFYIKVERGALNEDHLGSVNYTMIQSREVARYNDGYAAVLDDVGQVPIPLPTVGNVTEYTGRDIRIQDINNNITAVPYEELSFLPINGVLEDFTIGSTGTGIPLQFVPEFVPKVDNYGYMSADPVEAMTVNAVATEGNFATVDVSLTNSGGTQNIPLGGSFTFADGENELDVTVNSFDGVARKYRLFVLVGDDAGTFCEDTISLFPTGYGSGLWLLHSLHSDYIFTPYDTGLSFNTVLDYEDSGSRSLANIISNPSWCNSNSPEYDGGGWHAANIETVSYFLDPRNYLDQTHIFSLENLAFNPEVHSVDGVRAMIAGSFMDTSSYDYAQAIYNAGQTAGVSPYLLASRIIQEMGYNGESALCSGTLPGYEGYYNFFNIGSVPDPSVENGALINGARYAMWGSDPDNETIDDDEASMMLPWDNIEDAITGGAIWIARSYIAVDQNTLYFQKFDVINNNDGLYQHQYAQNISMAYTEGARYFTAYASGSMLDESFEFLIPVYSGMPESYGDLP